MSRHATFTPRGPFLSEFQNTVRMKNVFSAYQRNGARDLQWREGDSVLGHLEGIIKAGQIFLLLKVRKEQIHICCPFQDE